jgi:predicted phage tail protein
VETLSQLTVNDVPPGAYYVRVRAINEIDRSGTSNEVVVTVP